jgi:glycosyltransferase involved in cell wall biosynthesis
MRVLVLAPYFDRDTPGESWSTYKWVEGISARCEATVLTSHGPGWQAGRSPLADPELVNWTHPTLTGRFARIDWELKPHYALFYWRARRWIRQALRAGVRFDVIHQVNPLSLRYPSPAAGLGVKYVLGPHAGSLPTPKGFERECGEKLWYRRLRRLDAWRIQHDPLLRKSFAGASAVLGVAPYVEEFLRPVGIQRFEIMAETGPDVVVDEPKPLPETGRPLRLLFVGRIIRTKGVIDAIRAVAIAAKTCQVTFDVVGVGDHMVACVEETRRLGVSHLVTFQGRKNRAEVYEHYRRADALLFPSFREPSGNVVFEALGFGLPVVSANVGGPGHVITPLCGIKVDVGSPEHYASDLAAAIITLDQNRSRLPLLSKAALERVRQVGGWNTRLSQLIELYREVTASSVALRP